MRRTPRPSAADMRVGPPCHQSLPPVPTTIGAGAGAGMGRRLGGDTAHAVQDFSRELEPLKDPKAVFEFAKGQGTKNKKAKRENTVKCALLVNHLLELQCKGGWLRHRRTTSSQWAAKLNGHALSAYLEKELGPYLDEALDSKVREKLNALWGLGSWVKRRIVENSDMVVNSSIPMADLVNIFSKSEFAFPYGRMVHVLNNFKTGVEVKKYIEDEVRKVKEEEAAAKEAAAKEAAAKEAAAKEAAAKEGDNSDSSSSSEEEEDDEDATPAKKKVRLIDLSKDELEEKQSLFDQLQALDAQRNKIWQKMRS